MFSLFYYSIIFAYSLLNDLALNLFFYREECSSKGGVNADTCASGFGVCCTCKYRGGSILYLLYWTLGSILTGIFFIKHALSFSVTVGCGSSSGENCTYFEVTGAVAGACASQICVSDDVCQVSPY